MVLLRCRVIVCVLRVLLRMVLIRTNGIGLVLVRLVRSWVRVRGLRSAVSLVGGLLFLEMNVLWRTVLLCGLLVHGLCRMNTCKMMPCNVKRMGTRVNAELMGFERR